ncbi:hypothetical protein Acsp06_52650 [Actinomycetospora sp. NBRC 106375]|uniref:hypothetical protein n=1 Tax=Actinomycetospora sp. NBRC 106375 TaxID=3032207 RepID=UPI0024A1514E|nr:hypothetical protein [Actinomycetospora sp. NBRC 106375]GLZ49080.1 hypothetical protein Acsp06_52650 [Actinomycetospora sp. NBRC 106375]
MTIRVLQTGLDPAVIDFGSPDFARFEGLTPETLRRANDDNVAGLRAAGFAVDNILIDTGATAVDVLRDAVRATPYDAVLIGAGVRLVAANTQLFEAIVNLVHAELPHARFVFNRGPDSTPDDIARWFASAEAAGPLR